MADMNEKFKIIPLYLSASSCSNLYNICNY